MVNDIVPFDQATPPPSIFEASWHPCLNVDSITVLHLFLCAVFPFLSATFYLFFRLVFGTLYPAYASYKAVKTKNVKEYVKWMMYWIVFALFTCLETIADIFISFWLPFYYELKILFVLWLMSPATKGSSILYRKFVHPAFTRRERDIDDYISKAKEQGYSTVLQMGSKGFSYATSVVMQTALRVSCHYGPFINKLQGALTDALFQLFHPEVNTSCSNAEFALDKKAINEMSKYPFNNDFTNDIEMPCHENQAFSHSDTSVHLSHWYSSVKLASTHQKHTKRAKLKNFENKQNLK